MNSDENFSPKKVKKGVAEGIPNVNSKDPIFFKKSDDDLSKLTEALGIIDLMSDPTDDSDEIEITIEKPSIPIPAEVTENERYSTISLPKITLRRHDELTYETIQFLPESLITLIVEGTGDVAMTMVQMRDTLDQPRYYARSGGKKHEWTTRIQKTSIFGVWKFIITYPDTETGRTTKINIPFYIFKELNSEIRETLVEAILPEVPIEIPVEEVAEVEIFEKEPLIIAKPIEEYIDEEIIQIVPLIEQADLTIISGIGEKKATSFAAAGYKSPRDVANASVEDLVQINGIGPASAQKILSSAIEFVNRSSEIPTETAVPWASVDEIKVADLGLLDVTAITGIGPKKKDDFEAFGFLIPEDVARASLTDLLKIKGIGPATAKKIKRNAIELVGISGEVEEFVEEDEVKINPMDLTSISGIGKKKRLDFEAAGFKTWEDVANTKIEYLVTIKGIGPATAKKLISNARRSLKMDREVVEDPKPDTIDLMHLTSISGIGNKKKDDFEKAGFMNSMDVANAEIENLVAIKGIGSATAKKLKKNATDLLEKYELI